MAEASGLSDRERAVLAAACDAFHPPLEPRHGEDLLLFSTRASDLGVAQAAEKAIALLAEKERRELSLFLRLLDGPLLGLVSTGSARKLEKRSAPDREKLLLALATSRVPEFRSGFQALKRLSSFLFYSLPDADGRNRLSGSVGYRGSARPPAGPPPLRVTSFQVDSVIECDVCVVGSGAGGGVVAAELASAGKRVVVLEAGPPDQAADFSQRELESTQRLYLDHGLAATRDLGVSVLAGRCIGGGTAINWQGCLRLPDFVRDEWSEMSDVDLFTSGRFGRAMDAVWTRIHASTDAGDVNANNAVLQRGCEALDYEAVPFARNARGCDNDQCGYCPLGCRVGGKQSTTVTYLHDAQLAGDTTVVANCRAERVMIDRGRATGVVATHINPDGRRVMITVRAPRVVACAGGIHSPALLQRSSVRLAQVGRNLFLHPTTAVVGLYDERVELWSGPPQSIVSSQFSRLDGNFGFRLESAPVHPGFMASSIPWTSAREHRRLMQRAAHASAIIVLTRDCEAGRVRSRRDGGVSIEYRPRAGERALISRGIAEAARVHFAAGAEEIHTLHAHGVSLRRSEVRDPIDVDNFCRRAQAEPVDRNRNALFSAHQMGTCRMGRDAHSAVCDERGEVFGVRGLFVADASLFPASSGVNPMITVMALAKCVAEGLEVVSKPS